MSFATRHRNDPMPSIPARDGLTFHRECDAARMAQLQGRSIDEMAARFAEGHRAYVASVNSVPAAWGWVATRSARIGELGVEMVIPDGERYLWNFVTLPEHRGLGIYPRLLRAILEAEQSEAERFWIAYAPENRASGSGIAKAGFHAVAEMSFDDQGRAALQVIVADGATQASRILGLPVTSQDLTPCWRCVRAGRPAMSCSGDSCQCDYQVAKSGCAA